MRERWIWNGSAQLGTLHLLMPLQQVMHVLPNGEWLPDEDFPGDVRSGWWEDRISDLLVQVYDHRAISISAHKEFVYQERNLIGMPRSEATELLGGSCLSPVSGDAPDDVSTSTTLGVDLTFWDNRVSSASISDYSIVQDPM